MNAYKQMREAFMRQLIIDILYIAAMLVFMALLFTAAVLLCACAI